MIYIYLIETAYNITCMPTPTTTTTTHVWIVDIMDILLYFNPLLHTLLSDTITGYLYLWFN